MYCDSAAKNARDVIKIQKRNDDVVLWRQIMAKEKEKNWFNYFIVFMAVKIKRQCYRH